LTREWPPDIYGGAGVHVEELVRELRPRADVHVHAFGPTRTGAQGHVVPAEFADANPALQTLAVDLNMVRDLGHLDVVHSHTWYTNFAGHVAGEIHGIPHVITAHSLEPRRPWKAEQLGGGYRTSSWIESSTYREATAIIAVSDGMRRDVIEVYPFLEADRVHVVRNGIDTVTWHPDPNTDHLEKYGISTSRPYVVFVGRITRQKGIPHLLAAIRRMDPDVQFVFCASAPDTPEIGRETARAVEELRETHDVVWIQEHAPRPVVQQILTHALAFLCPSIYEPLGIVNLEAMACSTAVIASDVGGIPEVVVDGTTGLLVHYDQANQRDFEVAFSDAINQLVADPVRAQAMGALGRQRAIDEFGWDIVAERTLAVYASAGATPGGHVR
jgi:starch synthase